MYLGHGVKNNSAVLSLDKLHWTGGGKTWIQSLALSLPGSVPLVKSLSLSAVLFDLPARLAYWASSPYAEFTTSYYMFVQHLAQQSFSPALGPPDPIVRNLGQVANRSPRPTPPHPRLVKEQLGSLCSDERRIFLNAHNSLEIFFTLLLEKLLMWKMTRELQNGSSNDMWHSALIGISFYTILRLQRMSNTCPWLLCNASPEVALWEIHQKKKKTQLFFFLMHWLKSYSARQRRWFQGMGTGGI